MEIRELRKAAKLSQAALAARVGMDRTRLSFAENGYVQLRTEESDAIRRVVIDEIDSQRRAQQKVLAGHGLAV